jgi:hypothetical protein
MDTIDILSQRQATYKLNIKIANLTKYKQN